MPNIWTEKYSIRKTESYPDFQKTKYGQKWTVWKIQGAGAWDSKQTSEKMFSKQEKAIATKINIEKQSIAMQINKKYL